MCLPVQNLLVSVPMYCTVTGYNYLSSLHSQLNSENGQIPLRNADTYYEYLHCHSYSSQNEYAILPVDWWFPEKNQSSWEIRCPQPWCCSGPGSAASHAGSHPVASLETGTGSHPVSGGLLPQPGPSVQQEGTTTGWVKGLIEGNISIHLHLQSMHCKNKTVNMT